MALSSSRRLIRKTILAGLLLCPFAAFAQQYPSPQFQSLGVGIAAPPSGVAGDFSGGSVTATGSTTPRTLAARASEQAEVLDYGAKCDGVTDDTGPIQNALSSGAGVVVLPANLTCYSASGITIPAGVTFAGAGVHQPAGGGAPTGSVLLCAAAATNCLTGSANTYDIRDMVVEFAGTIGSATGTCIYINGGSHVHISRVDVYNCHEGYYWYTGSAGGLVGHMLQDYALQVNDAYVVQDGFNEIYITDCRFGGHENNSIAFIRQTATYGSPGFVGSLYLANDQFNSDGTSYFMQLVNCASCSGSAASIDVQIVNSHIEQITQAIFTSDSSWHLIQNWTIVGNTFLGSNVINAQQQPAFALNATTALTNVAITGNSWAVHDFTLAPTAAFSATSITGNTFFGVISNSMAISLTSNNSASVLSFNNNSWIGSLTLSGFWGHLTVLGNTHTGGPLTDGATGWVMVMDPNVEMRVVDKPYTVSTLPACNSTAAGLRAQVSDATAATFNSVPVGGGSTTLHVWCNGTNWVEGY